MHKKVIAIVLFIAAMVMHLISCFFISEIVVSEVFEYRINSILFAFLLFLLSIIYFFLVINKSRFDENVIRNASLVAFLFDVSFTLSILHVPIIIF